MTEEETRAWMEAHFDVPRETWAKLERYVALLLAEAGRQNLIAESTKAIVWSRHIVDSAQLIPLTTELRPGRTWIDLGSGAGLPAIVVAILSGWKTIMIESRRMRIEFLRELVTSLDLDAQVFGGRVESMIDQSVLPGGVISARAYAPMDRLFESAIHLADEETLWVLPKGRNWQNELASARKAWHGEFHVEHSITDPESAIIVARSVRRKGRK